MFIFDNLSFSSVACAHVAQYSYTHHTPTTSSFVKASWSSFVDVIEEFDILIDYDYNGYLLQIFTLPGLTVN